MIQDNFFVQKRKLQKMDMEHVIRENPDFTDEQIILIMARKTGLKHTTLNVMLNELKLEMVKK